MFWKSHLDEEACVDFGAIAALKTRCQSGAAGAGAPEACTRCTELAEAWVPPMNNLGILALSKCERLGALPQGDPIWHDSAKRLASDDGRLTMEPFHVAFSYCTGTEGGFVESSGIGLGAYDFAQHGERLLDDSMTYACSTDDGEFGSTPQFQGTRRIRVARVVSEVHDDGSLGSVPGPVVSNVERVVTRSGWDSTCHTYDETTTQDQLTAAWLAPLPYEHVGWNGGPDVRTKDGPYGGRAIDEELRACGLTQRVSYWNRACSDLPAVGLALGNPPPAADGTYRASDGARLLQETSTSESPGDTRCSVLEARTFVPSCVSGTCGASGLCREGPAPTVVQFNRLFP
jgi:hypothetical protein